MEDLTKDQLHEAYQLAKSMGNAFRAFKNTEEFILRVVQLQGSFEQYTNQVEKLKAEAEAATTETADLVAKLGVARAELDQEVVRLAEYRKSELSKIETDLAAARDDVDRQISAFQAEVSDSKQASEEARKEFEGLMASLHAEIEAKQGVLTTLQGEIDALKQKFS